MKSNIVVGLFTISVLISFIVIRNYINKPVDLTPRAQLVQQCTNVERNIGLSCKEKCNMQQGRFIEWCTTNTINPGCRLDEITVCQIDTNDPEYHARCCKPIIPSVPPTLPVTPILIPSPTLPENLTPTVTFILTPTLTQYPTPTPTVSPTPVDVSLTPSPTIVTPVPTNVCIIPKPRLIINCPPPCQPISSQE